MGVLSEKLKAAISAQVATEATIELDGESIQIAARPLTAADMVAIKRAHPDFTNNPTFEGMVDLLILKARMGDGDGEKAFAKDDKPFLMRLNMGVIGSAFHDLFANQITTTSDETIVDEKKTS